MRRLAQLGLCLIVLSGCSPQAGPGAQTAVEPAVQGPAPQTATAVPATALAALRGPLAPPSAPAAPAPAFPDGFAALGEQHADEVVAKQGEAWLGLMVGAPGVALVEGTIEVSEPQEEGLYDTIVNLRLADGARSEGVGLALRGRGLVAGPVAVAERRAVWVSADRSELHLRLAGQPTGVVALTRTGVAPEGQVCTLSFERAGVRQDLTVYGAATGIDTPARPGVLKTLCPGESEGVTDADLLESLERWVSLAADLDRDGRVDLIVHPDIHYNVMQSGLFLSSRASATRPLGLFGTVWQVGC